MNDIDQAALVTAIEQALKRLGAGSFVGGVQNQVAFEIKLSPEAETRLIDLIEQGQVPLEIAGGKWGPKFEGAKVFLQGDATIHTQSVRAPLRAPDLP